MDIRDKVWKALRTWKPFAGMPNDSVLVRFIEWFIPFSFAITCLESVDK